jgi:stage II sporulation protein D
MFWMLMGICSAQSVRISVFNEIPVKSLVLSSLKGGYKVYCDSTIFFELLPSEVVYVSLMHNGLVVRNSKKAVGLFSRLRVEAINADAVLRVNLIDPNSGIRQYNDNLFLSVAYGRILLVNEVNPDNYIAGVVEAEAGPNAGAEFYKAQSILVRTYLYGHFLRHESEGFHLCDEVHCQAYKGRSVKNAEIVDATKATSGLVAVGPDTTFITAVFHANCGGQTETAARAWLGGKTYLQPVKDPFCQNSSSARWTKIIPLEQWKSYLKGHGVKIKPEVSPGVFDFTQLSRKQYYKVLKDSVPVKQIRTDFQLRSSFFSVVASHNEITIKGRGFGHGVGLCQDGAMQMAKAGYKYEDILFFYYKGIRIVKFSEAVKTAQLD